jgi:hypothetical protein
MHQPLNFPSAGTTDRRAADKGGGLATGKPHIQDQHGEIPKPVENQLMEIPDNPVLVRQWAAEDFYGVLRDSHSQKVCIKYVWLRWRFWSSGGNVVQPEDDRHFRHDGDARKNRRSGHGDPVSCVRPRKKKAPAMTEAE